MSTALASARIAAAAAALVVACAAHGGEAARELHGASDAFAAPGLVLAWAVERGREEASTQVVVRIDADPALYRAVGARGVDPFGGAATTLQPPTRIAGPVTLRWMRAQVADFPRTEFLFYREAAPAEGAPPRLVVYYAGMPDTTPEFADAARAAAYLDDRVAKLGRPGKPP